MPDAAAPWPFGATDGGPASRPLVVDLENVLVGRPHRRCGGRTRRRHTAGLGVHRRRPAAVHQRADLAYDEAFRSGRGLKDRVVGALVDDAESMAAYVAYARAGGAALWIHVADRDDASRLVRHLVDDEIVHLWFHGADAFESMRVR